jgi:PPP family 3-phenylpropionic acid transporter
MRKIWPFSFYFIFYAAVAAYAPYMVLYYQSVGLSGAQIGSVTGITPLITLVSVPFWTGLADKTGRQRLLMSIAMLLGISALIIFPFLESYVLILLVAVAFHVSFTSVIPIADSATMFMLGKQKELYGRLRLGGTLGFGLTATFAGLLVEDYGLKMAFFGGAFLLFLGFLVSQKLEHGKAVQDRSTRPKEIAQLLKNPYWLTFLVLAFAGGMAFAATNTYLFPYMKEIGASEGLMGLALTVGTLAEIPVMLFVNRMIQRFQSYGLLVFSIVMTGVRLLIFALSTSALVVLFAQFLNGFAYPIMWVAGVAYADEHAPEGLRTSAQGLFNAMVMGIGLATGSFVGGLLLENLGGRALYAIFGGIVFLILLLVTLVRAKLPPEEKLSSEMASV